MIGYDWNVFDLGKSVSSVSNTLTADAQLYKSYTTRDEKPETRYEKLIAPQITSVNYQKRFLCVFDGLPERNFFCSSGIKNFGSKKRLEVHIPLQDLDALKMRFSLQPRTTINPFSPGKITASWDEPVRDADYSSLSVQFAAIWDWLESHNIYCQGVLAEANSTENFKYKNIVIKASVKAPSSKPLMLIPEQYRLLILTIGSFIGLEGKSAMAVFCDVLLLRAYDYANSTVTEVTTDRKRLQALADGYVVDMEKLQNVNSELHAKLAEADEELTRFRKLTGNYSGSGEFSLTARKSKRKVTRLPSKQ